MPKVENSKPMSPDSRTAVEAETSNLLNPDSRMTVEVAGKSKDLFMSAGMLQELVVISEQLEDVSEFHLNPVVQSRCLVHLLVERDTRGVPVEDVSELTLMAFPMEPKDADKVCTWMGEHLLDFFIRGTSNMTRGLKVMEKQTQKMEILKQSSTGTNN